MAPGRPVALLARWRRQLRPHSRRRASPAGWVRGMHEGAHHQPRTTVYNQRHRTRRHAQRLAVRLGRQSCPRASRSSSWPTRRAEQGPPTGRLPRLASRAPVRRTPQAQLARQRLGASQRQPSPLHPRQRCHRRGLASPGAASRRADQTKPAPGTHGPLLAGQPRSHRRVDAPLQARGTRRACGRIEAAAARAVRVGAAASPHSRA